MGNVQSNTTLESTEIYIKKVLAGDSESVRNQLMDAIEALGYDIIEEEPNIVARRGNRGWANWAASANVLDYATSLTVRLKPLSSSSTQATFDYGVKSVSVTSGDKRIVLQEANTIAAISKNQAIERLCPVCETESTDDSRFCRKCGAPLTSESAELEVLRIMAETSAGKSAVVTSSVSLVISTILLLVTWILTNADLIKPKLIPVLIIAGGAGVLLSIVMSFFGWNRLSRALNRPETAVPHVPRFVNEQVEADEPRELQSPKVPASVTEGTTNLLDGEFGKRREKEKVPVSKRRDTNDL